MSHWIGVGNSNIIFRLACKPYDEVLDVAGVRMHNNRRILTLGNENTSIVGDKSLTRDVVCRDGPLSLVGLVEGSECVSEGEIFDTGCEDDERNQSEKRCDDDGLVEENLLTNPLTCAMRYLHGDDVVTEKISKLCA